MLAYKVCMHIAAGLKCHSAAIRSALAKYNKQVQLLHPPRDTLEWDNIIAHSFLTEFDLLRFLHDDIHSREWEQPVVCEAIIQHFKLKCACAELEQLNVEIPRPATSIQDESQNWPAHITHVWETNLALVHKLQHCWKLHAAINMQHVQQIGKICQMKGYTGNRQFLFFRHRVGTPGSCPPSPSTACWPTLIRSLGSEDASTRVSLGMGDVTSNGTQDPVLETGIAVVTSRVMDDSEDETDEEDDEIWGLVERLNL